MEDLYKRHQRQISALVRYFSHRFQLDLDEAISEANLAFLKAARTFKPELKIRFSTYLNRVISNRLLDLARRTGRRRRLVITDSKLVYSSGDRSHVSISEIARELSADAQHVIRMVLDSPGEWISALAGRSALRDRLWEDYDWDLPRINRVFREIREAIA